jgi:copper transport protein
MSWARRSVGAVAAAAVGLMLTPAVASAHAYLVKTVPTPGAVLDTPPPSIQLTFDEAVEPRFAIISVTDASGAQQTTAPVSRSPSNPDTLVVPVKHLPSGWYLIYWRAISVDGHPVQGAYTFAVGPSPGPPPQFPIPHISETATDTNLVIARWAMFLSVMVSIGLFVFRTLIGRPVVRRVDGVTLRPLTLAFAIAAVVGLIATAVYLDIATAVDSLRSPFDVANLVPLFRVTAFGRAYVDLELVFGLFVVAAAIALWIDRPEREQRSIAELLSMLGALAAAASVLLVPGLAGHAAQTAPRGLALTLDWLHLVSGSVWLGGLVGLLLLWFTLPVGRRLAGLALTVPRFSLVALVSVLVLLASGTWASILHLPVLNALWTTSYGIAIMVKVGLLAAAMALGAVNLLRTKPRLVEAEQRHDAGDSAVRLLRRTISGETLLVTCAVFAAAVLSSLAPPAAALAQLGSQIATVGPGPVVATAHDGPYTFKLRATPNAPATENSFSVQILKNGQPLQRADVTLTFEMLDMQMGNQEYQMTETSPGVYSHSAPALVMAGRWGLLFSVNPKQGAPFSALVVDHAG